MELTAEQLPEAVRDGLRKLFKDEVYFVPIRHHSPACAFALQALIREVRPAAILVEGPDCFDSLIPLLLDEATRPPVAVLMQSASQDADGNEEKARGQTRSAFFPLCDYSPEWVALREGQLCGAQLAFIDLPWGGKSARLQGTGQTESLQAERYLAHSQWLAALAREAGCRDHHELWDHLFELRPLVALADWRRLLSDVFCWCAMARLDYEPEVLESENSLPRERHMARWIKTWRGRVSGPIVVVTGGFHTPELLNWSQSREMPDAPAPGTGGQWLIRYGFEQLDALNDYAAGMPSPAYYQRVWDGLCAGSDDPWQEAAADLLLQLARQTRSLELAETLSTADAEAAQLQALRLAALRGHAGPGRTDLLDAITSCFLKRAVDDGQSGLLEDARKLLAGSRLGDIPLSAGSPPLVEDARRLARSYGLRLDDGEARTAKLDLYRKPAHRGRSHFFHLMRYLDTGLATWQGGPDFMAGTRLDMLFEEWRYAWTPMVEARLIQCSVQGISLQSVALVRLQEEEQALSRDGQARSASRAVHLVVKACLIGLHQRLPDLFRMLAMHLDEDARFSSVVACGHQLLGLWQASEPLGVQGNSQIGLLLGRVWPAALFLLPALARSKAEEETDAVRQLLSLRELCKRLSGAELSVVGADTSLFTQCLQQLLCHDCAPGVEAAAVAILYLDGACDGGRLGQLLAQRFGTGASPEMAVRFLNALLHAAPELPLHEPCVLDIFNRCLLQWEEADFIAFLPDLRHAFTHLNPQETDRLALAAGALNGSGGQDILQYHLDISEADLHEGLQLQSLLLAALQADELADWGAQKDAV